MILALTRDISPAIERCELTYLSRLPIDLAAARRQHDAYERTLSDLGCTIQRLPTSSAMPDSVFIEDTAVVFDELAVIARPGAESRRIETEAVAAALAPHRRLERIESPGTLDGGDVLVLPRRVFVGSSGRTNPAGIDQLGRIMTPFGYRVEAIEVRGCLHLKSAVSALDDRTVLLNPEWIAASRFSEFAALSVDPREPFAANALRVGEYVIFPREFPLTRARLAAAGFAVRDVEVSELAKAEGGVTCCSIMVVC
jgi:dimethylargininase